MNNTDLLKWIKLYFPELNSNQIGRLRVKFEAVERASMFQGAGIAAHVINRELGLELSEDGKYYIWRGRK